MMHEASLEDHSGRPRPSAEIARFLSEPSGVVSLKELVHFWKVTRITLIFERVEDLEIGMRLPIAFRGALGHMLKAVSEERLNTSRQFGTAFQALYADHLRTAEGWFVPKPFVTWVHARQDKIYVQISLFGDAGYWRDDVIEAALRIMLPEDRGGMGGISLSTGQKPRRPWKVVDVFWREKGYCSLPPPKPIFLLSSVTPMILTARDVNRLTFQGLIFTIIARIYGLARWNGLALPRDPDFTHLKALTARVNVQPVFRPKFTITERKSRSYGRTVRKEIGLQVELKISDYPEELWPGFIMGTQSHAGYDVSQGFGRYMIGDP